MTRFKAPLTTYGSSPAASPVHSPVRSATAWALLAASAALDRWAQRVAMPPAAPPERLAQAEFEFYAQAGAPEGALYVDGQFVGWLQGVQRL